MTVLTGNLLSADYSSGTVQGSLYQHISLNPHKNSESYPVLLIFVLQKKRDSERLSTLLKDYTANEKQSQQSAQEPDSSLLSILPPYEPLLDSPAFDNSYYLYNINDPSVWSSSHSMTQTFRSWW